MLGAGTHMDMKDIARVFRDVDLLWSEGATYNMGFASTLATWPPLFRPRLRGMPGKVPT